MYLTIVRRWTALAHIAAAAVEVQIALGLGVGGEPVFSIDLLIVGGEGWREVFVAFALVVGHALAVHEDDFEILLVEPDLALEVPVIFDDGFGRGGEDIGVECVDLLPAEVGDVVLREVLGGEDEGQTVLDIGEVGGRHHDALKGVLRSEDDVLVAGAILVEDDVGDLGVLPVGFAGVFGDGLNLDALAEGVGVARAGELAFPLTHLLDDGVWGETAGGRRGVKWAEARGILAGVLGIGLAEKRRKKSLRDG